MSPQPGALLCRRAGERAGRSGRDDHLDGVFDPLARVQERGGQVGKRKGMRVNPCRVEPLFRHQRHRAPCGAAAFAANAVDIDIVLHEMSEIRRHRLVRECREADFSAAIGHMNGLIDGGFGAGALDHIIGADPAGELLDHVDRVLVGDVDDAVRAQLLANGKAAVARSRQDHGARAKRLGDSHREQPDWAGPITTTLSPATSPPSSVRPYIEVRAVTTRVASASLMVSGTRTSVLIWLTAYSAKPPSVVKPLAR